MAMAKGRVGISLLAGLLVYCGSPATATAQQVEPKQLLRPELAPKQAEVARIISTPTEQEQKSCEVKAEQGQQPGTSSWILLDARKQLMRRFFDSNADKKIDIWSYYKDGVEVYREIDTN